MNNDISLNQLNAYIIKGKKDLNPRELHHTYDLSFKAWHETWEKTYQLDFHSTKKLPSDEFTRQDEILALFYAGECFALSFFSNVNMKDDTACLDSYFSPWPRNAIEGLCAHGTNVVICSQFTVCENFRGEGPTLLGKTPWKMLLAGMVVKYFLNSGRDAMTGTMRVNKGMEKVSYKIGAVPIIQHLEYDAGEEKTLVDLVAFFQDNVLETYRQNPYASILDSLWENRNGRKLRIAA